MTVEQAQAIVEFANEVRRLRCLCDAYPKMQGQPGPREAIWEMTAPELIYWWAVYRKYGELANAAEVA